MSHSFSAGEIGSLNNFCVHKSQRDGKGSTAYLHGQRCSAKFSAALFALLLLCSISSAKAQGILGAPLDYCSSMPQKYDSAADWSLLFTAATFLLTASRALLKIVIARSKSQIWIANGATERVAAMLINKELLHATFWIALAPSAVYCFCSLFLHCIFVFARSL